MPPQTLSEKVQLKEIAQKIAILAKPQNLCYVNHLEVSSWKIKSCCNKISNEEWTVNIHITWEKTKSKVQI